MNQHPTPLFPWQEQPKPAAKLPFPSLDVSAAPKQTSPVGPFPFADVPKEPVFDQINPYLKKALKITLPLLPCLLGGPGFFLAGLMVGYTLSSEESKEDPSR
ncbi:hypothetical protein BWI97_18300 [Siphonobacter sp. BAB-5405]|uniref:hypothetical protein n=1 Tax=Siphonobacter sp. BAB-5405 TaxID=1864825 RepID=UPI000C807A27|nr:hypothetical protein [Siphonobacter sp. BAB-5405]PMD93544.1 hypothetical protein BWI97_18300 [Siphonobacter sp. BAB-5405]